MKVCKKCKSHVANNAKICKKCGADVSKAKIIKQGNQKSNHNKSKSNNSASSVKKNAPQTKLKKKNVEVKTSNDITKKKYNISINHDRKNSSIDNKKLSKLFSKFSSVKKFKISISKEKIVLCLNKLYGGLKLFVIYVYKLISFVLIELFIGIKHTGLLLVYNFKQCYHYLVLSVKKVLNFSKLFGRSVYKLFIEIKDKLRLRIIEKKSNKEKEKLDISTSEEELEEVYYEEEKKTIKKRKRGIKFAVILIFVLVLLIVSVHYGKVFYENLSGKPLNVVSSKKADKDKLFNMDDIISYKNADYKVVKIETSQGNTYKKPKKGNQFLIVTVYIKNNSKGKVSYSYENWTMSNSKDEEKHRIFTSINVDTALYSGELVVGGVKTGSMVFEQPIDDESFKINFYELKKDKDGNEVIDKDKRVFSVSVKNPGVKNNKGNEKEKKQETKIVKTEEKSKS